MFQKISDFFQKIWFPSKLNLTLSVSAVSRLNQEREKTNQSLLMEIRILRDSKKKGSVHIGFLDKEDTRSMIHPSFGHFISEQDYLTLAGGEISYDSMEKKFLYYPNIDLEWKDTPKRNIKRIHANRKFTYQNQIWTSEEGVLFDPIEKILNMPEVLSCYAKGNLLQIEFFQNSFNQKIEEEVSEWILIYFSYLYLPLAGSLQNPP